MAEQFNSRAIAYTSQQICSIANAPDDTEAVLKNYASWYHASFIQRHPPAVYCHTFENSASCSVKKTCETISTTNQANSNNVAKLSKSASTGDVALQKLADDQIPFCGQTLGRKWIFTPNRAQITSDSSRFRLCCYNILCQETLTTTPHLYTNCKPGCLKWDSRWKLLSDEMSIVNADIFCLQEVTQTLYTTDVRPFFAKMGFESAFKKRTGNKPDGCAIFWRDSKFTAEDVDLVAYKVPSTFVDRDNVGLAVRLRLNNMSVKNASLKKSTAELVPKRVVVATTHLLFNPGRGDIKLVQLAMFLARVRECALNRNTSTGPYDLAPYSLCPTIICGDFNATPGSPLYNFITAGVLNYNGLLRSDVSGQKKKATNQLLTVPLWPRAIKLDENCRLIANNKHTPDKNVSNVSVSSDAGNTSSDVGVLRHEFKFLSAYDHKTAEGGNEISTYHGTTDCANVDYIFYSPTISGSHHSVWETRTVPLDIVCTGRYTLPGKKRLDNNAGCLPNNTCGSDHLSVAADFELL